MQKFSKILPFLISSLIFISFISTTMSIAHAHGMSDAEKATAIGGSTLQYIWLGATHMLSGFDHLAFVFGIVFFLRSFGEIAKYVTTFTVGHSITLIYATLNGIQLNYYIIDGIIALSVCYIAFHNLDGFRKYLNTPAPNMLLMIFALGLIHGFGLSTILQELPLDKDHLLTNIISFNIGIELGQLLALMLMLIVIMGLRKTTLFPLFSKVVNLGLIVVGAALFFMQMNSYIKSQNSPISKQLDKTSITSTKAKTEKQLFVPLKEANIEWQETINISIPANKGIEYKFTAEKDASFSYSWKTENGEEIFFDFHGEPKGDTTGYFKSYKEATNNNSSGKLTAPFEGTHGWYWANKTSEPVTVILKAVGDYKRTDQ